ncbi:unnamed protein product [marine sediment metagenome]|uniref:Glycosyl transferase family 1 domain-containing protein n=1 Tax=marine sediment metagenome TaxID=412755 RepID=X1EJ91_9ZZZZ
MREELVKLRIANPHKIVVVPLGLELERYLKIENNGPGNRDYKSIGIIGRLVPVKNHKMFLDAAKKLKDTLSSVQRMKFLIVGDGPLRQELEEYARRLGIQQNVVFTGWLEDLEKVYPQLDIVTLTSLNEGTPVALIEAQAAACPCVATNVGGVTDVVEDGRSGFLVPPHDIDKFIEALLKLLNNPELAKSLGEFGRERMKNKFNKTCLFRDTEYLYEELLLCKKRLL